MSSTKTTPLHKVTDDNLWDAAECPFRRLCIVVHAAFIDAGFLPVGAPPPASNRSLSRSYSLPQRPDEDLVALRLCRRPRRRGDRTRTVLHICAAHHSTGRAAGGGRLERHARLDEDAAAAALSGVLDDTARALRAPGSAAHRLWKLLDDGLCRGLFLDACRASGVPVEPGFASLPGDVKALILSRLDSGSDVAMAECASRELRDLAAEHDADVWEARCDSLDRPCACLIRDKDSRGRDLDTWSFRSLREVVRNMTWKKRYMYMITQPPPPAMALAEPTIQVERAAAAANTVTAEIRALVNVAANVRGKDAGGADGVVRCNGYGYRRRHGAGAIQSPSSRYRWRHR